MPPYRCPAKAGDLVAFVPSAGPPATPTASALVDISKLRPFFDLSSSNVGPSFEEPCASYGVALGDGQWATLHSSSSSGSGSTTILIAPIPSTVRRRPVIVRKANEEDVTHILHRVHNTTSTTYEIADAGSEEEDDEGPPRVEVSAANARWAFFCTSIPGAHVRCPIQGTGLWHHGTDTGDGTVIHYSRQEVRLDPLYVLAGENGVGPLVQVDKAGDVEGTLVRAVERIGEKNYSAVLNNCEHFATYSLGQPVPRSRQVEGASLAVGVVSGSIAVLGLAGAAAPGMAVAAAGLGGAGIGAAFITRVMSVQAGARRRRPAAVLINK